MGDLDSSEGPTEPISVRITKTDYALLEKLVKIKGGTMTAVFREALHILFASYGMLPEESTRLLLGQFLRAANIDPSRVEANREVSWKRTKLDMAKERGLA